MPLPTQASGDQLADFATTALAWIESEIPGVDLVSAMLNQRTHENGDLYDVMDVGFRILPDQTVYYVHPDASKDWPSIAVGEIILKMDKVLSIYAGLPERASLVELPPDWDVIH
ncbi:MAG TPA: hypothetical protein VKA83_07810 [Methylomirabilota bacterium]|nr:hypothetical protein [Methylomirabilota bacterium]